MRIISLNDSQLISKNDVSKYQIENYCTLSKGEYKVAFVGFIINREEIIMSFPKKYVIESDLKSEILILLNVIKKSKSFKGPRDYKEEENFPLAAYLSICNYYIQNGLFHELETINDQGYNGKVNWRKTIKNSTKIISDNNIIFMPFIIEKSSKTLVFLSECMSYILYDGYKNFGKFFSMGVKYSNNPKSKIFSKYELVIKALKYIKNETFKDKTIKLIDFMINYFEWKSSFNKRTTLIISDFSSVWEKMIEKYLNKNFYVIDSNNMLCFKENINKYKFKKVPAKTESNETILKNNTRKYTVEYDHLNSKDDEEVYLFDSKYYNEVKNLNYKQSTYYYFIKSTVDIIGKKIFNGLILPSSEEYYQKIHIDRRDNDGLFIMEHYLNIREVMKFYIKNNS